MGFSCFKGFNPHTSVAPESRCAFKCDEIAIEANQITTKYCQLFKTWITRCRGEICFIYYTRLILTTLLFYLALPFVLLVGGIGMVGANVWAGCRKAYAHHHKNLDYQQKTLAHVAEIFSKTPEALFHHFPLVFLFEPLYCIGKALWHSDSTALESENSENSVMKSCGRLSSLTQSEC